jgi:hypothetical protein
VDGPDGDGAHDDAPDADEGAPDGDALDRTVG